MKPKLLPILVAITGTLCSHSYAQIYDTNGDFVQTFAGSGFSGYVDGIGVQTMFDLPELIVADSHSNLFVWDADNSRIREIAPNGTVTTFAGGGNPSTGTGTNVSLSFMAMTIDHNDNIWCTGSPLYEITSNAVITRTSLSGLSAYVEGICADSSGNIYISDFMRHKIYRYATNDILSVFAGSGNAAYADGNGIFTAFNYPAALACDQANDIFVWDSGNNLIRRIDQSQNVTTFAGKYQISSSADGVGTNAAIGSVSQMCFDNSGNLYLACGSCIRKITPTTNVVTMAGSFTQTGYTNCAGNLALFNDAGGVCIFGGTVFVADCYNERIRDITFNPQPQVVAIANLGIGTFAGITITGIVGRAYQIQSSPNMVAWSTQATLLLNSSPFLWINQNPVSGNKFYRAVLLP